MTPDDFIARWTGLEGGAERANYALFLSELCDVIGVPRPDPASASSEKNDYVFERLVRRPDGSNGRIDLYKRDAFVLEAKQSRQSARTLTGEANDKIPLPRTSRARARPRRRSRPARATHRQTRVARAHAQRPAAGGGPPLAVTLL